MGTPQGQGSPVAHRNTHTNTQPAQTHVCIHAVWPCAQACTHIYLVVLPVCTHVCTWTGCTRMHAHSSHLHIHTQMHMTPAHTYAPTQMLYPFVPQHSQLCKCSDCMDRCPIVLPISCVQPLPVLPIHTCKLLHLLIYVCTHICMPNCPAKTHTHTKPSCLHLYTHMHATCLSACAHTHMHTQPRYLMFPACAIPTLEGARVCEFLRTTNLLHPGPSTRRAAHPALPPCPRRMEPHRLLGAPRKQGPVTRPGFWSPATAEERSNSTISH